MIKKMPSHLELLALNESTEEKNNVILQSTIQDLHRYRSEYGEQHEKVAALWSSLGLIRLHMNRNTLLAKACLNQALQIYMHLEHGISTAVTLTDLGFCHEKLNDMEGALSSYYKAMDLFFSCGLCESHPRVIATRRFIDRLVPRKTITKTA